MLLKIVTMDSFPKTIAQLNSYRNARITAIFEFVDKLDFTYFVYFTLAITNFRGPLDFSAPKKLSLGGLPPGPPATTPLLACVCMNDYFHRLLISSQYMHIRDLFIN